MGSSSSLRRSKRPPRLESCDRCHASQVSAWAHGRPRLPRTWLLSCRSVSSCRSSASAFPTSHRAMQRALDPRPDIRRSSGVRGSGAASVLELHRRVRILARRRRRARPGSSGTQQDGALISASQRLIIAAGFTGARRRRLARSYVFAERTRTQSPFPSPFAPGGLNCLVPRLANGEPATGT
jgi:hypothetical protein